MREDELSIACELNQCFTANGSLALTNNYVCFKSLFRKYPCIKAIAITSSSLILGFEVLERRFFASSGFDLKKSATST
jgi:hypothetical protein